MGTAWLRHSVGGMMDTISLGPFVLPAVLLLIIGAMAASLAAGWWAGKSRGIDVEPSLWKILVASLVGARAAFVFLYSDLYAKSPWSVLDIRDGGFVVSAGLLALIVSSAYFIHRQRAAWIPLLTAVVTGTAFWGMGLAALTLAKAAVQELPRIELARLGGGTVPINSFVGKPLVINMWATWCPPCRREMPVLRDAQGQYKDIVFIFANQGEAGDTVTRYLQSERLSLDNVLLDATMSVGRETGSLALPTTLFFNEKGVLVGRRVGELSAASLSDRLRSLRSDSPR